MFYKDRRVDPAKSELLFGATEAATKRHPVDQEATQALSLRQWASYIPELLGFDNMAVNPDHFRSGYGSTLLNHGISIAIERDSGIRHNRFYIRGAFISIHEVYYNYQRDRKRRAAWQGSDCRLLGVDMEPIEQVNALTGQD